MPGGTLYFGDTVSGGTIYVAISLDPITNPPLDSYRSWGEPCYQYRSSDSGYYTYTSGGTITLSYTYRVGEVTRGQLVSRVLLVSRNTEDQAKATVDGYNDYRTEHDLSEATYEYNASTGKYDVYISTYATSAYEYLTQRTGRVSGTMPTARVTSAYLSPSSVTLEEGKSQSLSLSFSEYPSGISCTVSYSTSDANVAVFSGGTVTGIGTGSATVYARVAAVGSGDASTASCAVTVKAAETTGYVMIRSGGTWKKADAYIRSGGTWKKADTYIRSGGTWKNTKG